jgi:hypothetical protein
MSPRDLGRSRRNLGLSRKRHLITLLEQFPGVFEIATHLSNLGELTSLLYLLFYHMLFLTVFW